MVGYTSKKKKKNVLNQMNKDEIKRDKEVFLKMILIGYKIELCIFVKICFMFRNKLKVFFYLYSRPTQGQKTAIFINILIIIYSMAQ